MVIHRLQIGKAFILIVDIEKLMVFQKQIIHQLCLFRKSFFTFGIAGDLGHRIENIQERRIELLLFRLSLNRSASGKKQNNAQQYRKEAG